VVLVDKKNGKKRLCCDYKDKWVKQESRTLDPEWRDSAGRAQKGNNGSRRPYTRPQSAGSLISRSRGVKPSRSIRYQSEQSVNQMIYKGATASRVVGKAAPWEPTRSKVATSRRSGLGYQESPNWDAGIWGPEARSTKSWRYAWRITSITSQKGERSIGTVSSGVIQESPTASIRVVPDRRTLESRVPKATLRPATQPAPPGAARKIVSAASQPPHHDSHATQREPRGNVPENKQKMRLGWNVRLH